MAPVLDEENQASYSFRQPSSSKKARAQNDEVRFLDYLGTDFSYLRRFILASQHMMRLVQTEAAQNSLEVQEKVIDTIEIAKETLTEAGASARPFIACPAHLVQHREAYFGILSAARPLVSYIEDPDVKLRLRRLLLPLTSTSRFQVVLNCESEQPKAENPMASPASWDGATPEADSTGPGPQALPKAPVAQKRTKRSSGSAVVRSTSSPPGNTSCASDCTSRVPSSRPAPSLRRLSASPYPNPALLELRRAPTPSGCGEDAEVTAPNPLVPDTPASLSPPAEEQPPPPPEQETSTPPELSDSSDSSDSSNSPPSPKPTLPPIAYVSPQTPKVLSLLQQQHRDFRAGYPAYRKPDENVAGGCASTSWDCTEESRTSLSGVDCNVSGDKHSAEPEFHIEVFSKEEYDEADENFRKGLGWYPTRWRNTAVTEPAPESAPAPTSPPELSWDASWEDAKPAQPGICMLPSYPADADQQTPLADSTCIIM